MTPTSKTYAVSSINNGTVIDHIPARRAIKIIKLLDLTSGDFAITLGLNLLSTSMEKKDLIKISDRELTHEESSHIAIFAPEATINIIRNYEITEKYQVEIPKMITTFIKCPNPNCITNHESIQTFFHIKKQRREITLQCHYCEQVFLQSHLTNLERDYLK